MSYDVDCVYCEKPIAKGDRIMLVDGTGDGNGHRIGSLHRRCYDYWLGLFAEARRGAEAKREEIRRKHGPQGELSFIRRHEMAS